MSVPNAWTRCHSPVITNMVATSQMEQSLNCRSWNKMLSNIYLCWHWNCILGPITIETRPIKQCKSLIWILIFVLFWYIRWRKAKTATKTIPPDDHLQKAGASGWSFANGQPLRMIICKRPVPSDDHLQGACPFGWSFQEAGPSRWSYARGRPLRFIICRRLVPLDDTLILFENFDPFRKLEHRKKRDLQFRSSENVFVWNQIPKNVNQTLEWRKRRLFMLKQILKLTSFVHRQTVFG